ncbi:MAG: CBS domain-containing protein [Neisseriaceae bacterium]|nr:CBS domain-containing protein [Neisseriaceae bacterium]
MDESSSHSLLERLFKRVSGCSSPDNPQEFIDLFQQAREQKAFDEDTLKRLENVVKFSQLAVRDTMISRAQMSVIKNTDNIERIIAHVVETTHSRFPVIADDKDHILGIVHAKDLLKHTLNPEHFKLENILRPAVFVPESKPLNVLLKAFQEQRNHMAIVVDEYGGTSGLVTFEDLIEQIVGKIEDEFDEDDSADNIFAVSTERWRVKATTEITDFNEFFGTHFSNEEVDTIGGFIIQEMGHLPTRGEKIVLEQLQFNVARADNRRLHTVMVSRVKE